MGLISTCTGFIGRRRAATRSRNHAKASASRRDTFVSIASTSSAAMTFITGIGSAVSAGGSIIHGSPSARPTAASPGTSKTRRWPATTCAPSGTRTT